MASECDASCEADPNFAVICGFLEKFGPLCGLNNIDFLDLQEMLENTQEVSPELIDLHVKLLRKARKSVHAERWERAIIKFCHTFCSQDAWELERFGYKKARLTSKLRILKELLESQFDNNQKFKTEINKYSAEDLRSQPIGRDTAGRVYWYQCDESCQVRIYKDDPDEETWTLIARDRGGLVSLISHLNNGDSAKSSSEPVSNEDSNSIEVEKPTLDTGQDSSEDKPSEEPKAEKTTSAQNSDAPDTTIIEENACDALDLSKNDDSDLLDLSVKACPPIRLKPLADLIEKKAVNSGKPMSFKRQLSEDELDDRQSKRSNLEVDEDSVGEEIEEPVMLVRGNGDGFSNKCGNREESPIIGEEIEETVLYFHGVGNGEDCKTGNSGKEEPKKNEYKLGKVIDSKTDKIENRSPDKKSRWDVGAPAGNSPPKMAAPSFFFGTRSFGFTPAKSASVSFGASAVKTETQSKIPDITHREIVDNKIDDNLKESKSPKNEDVTEDRLANEIVEATETSDVATTHHSRKDIDDTIVKIAEDNIAGATVEELPTEEEHIEKKTDKIEDLPSENENNPEEIKESHQEIESKESSSDIAKESMATTEEKPQISKNVEAHSVISKLLHEAEASPTDSIAKNVDQEITSSIANHLKTTEEKVVPCSDRDIEDTIPSDGTSSKESLEEIAAEVSTEIEADITQTLKDEVPGYSFRNIGPCETTQEENEAKQSTALSKVIDCETAEGILVDAATVLRIDDEKLEIVDDRTENLDEENKSIGDDGIERKGENLSRTTENICQDVMSQKQEIKDEREEILGEASSNCSMDKDNLKLAKENADEAVTPEIEEKEKAHSTSSKDNVKVDVDSSCLTENFSDQEVIATNEDADKQVDTEANSTSSKDNLKFNVDSSSRTDDVSQEVISQREETEEQAEIFEEENSMDKDTLKIDTSCRTETTNEEVIPEKEETDISKEEKSTSSEDKDNFKIDFDSCRTENASQEVILQKEETPKQAEILKEEKSSSKDKDNVKIDFDSSCSTENVRPEVIYQNEGTEKPGICLDEEMSISSTDQDTLKIDVASSCRTEDASREILEDTNSKTFKDKDNINIDDSTAMKNIDEEVILKSEELEKPVDILEEANSSSSKYIVKPDVDSSCKTGNVSIQEVITKNENTEKHAEILEDSTSSMTKDSLKIHFDSLCRTENVIQGVIPQTSEKILEETDSKGSKNIDNMKLDMDDSGATVNIGVEGIPKTRDIEKQILEDENSTISVVKYTSKLQKEEPEKQAEILEDSNSKSLKEKDNLELKAHSSSINETVSEEVIPQKEETEKRAELLEEENLRSSSDTENVSQVILQREETGTSEDSNSKRLKEGAHLKIDMDVSSRIENISQQVIPQKADILEDANSKGSNDASTATDIIGEEDSESKESQVVTQKETPEILEVESSQRDLKLDIESSRTTGNVISQEVLPQNKEAAKQVQILSDNSLAAKSVNTSEEDQMKLPSKSETSPLSKSVDCHSHTQIEQVGKSELLETGSNTNEDLFSVPKTVTEKPTGQEPTNDNVIEDIPSDTDYDNADIAEMCYSPLPDSEPEHESTEKATTIEEVDQPDDPLCLSSENSLDGTIKRFKIQKNPEPAVEVAKSGGKAIRGSWRGRRGRGRGGYRGVQKAKEVDENPVNGSSEIVEVLPEETGVRRSSRRRLVESVPIAPSTGKARRGRGGKTGNVAEPERIVDVPENNSKRSKLSKVAKEDAEKTQIDCSEGVVVQGVLIKGDITLKIKDQDKGEPTPKNGPFLSCVNIQKLKEPDTGAESPVSVKSSNCDDQEGSDVVIIEDDPLGGSDSVEAPKKKPMTLSSFQLDHDDTPLQMRAFRKRRNQSDNEDQKDLLTKKRKMKAKRQVDLKLRKSIEEQKKLDVSSSEEEKETRKPIPVVPEEKTTPRSRAKRKKTLLGLDIPESVALAEATGGNVRQSRRIAQIKIKEEAERRKIDDLTHQEPGEKKKKSKKNEDKDFKVEKTKKRSKQVEEEEEEDDEEVIEIPSDGDEKKKLKRKRKHKDPRKIFDEANPWRSSSESSSNEEQVDDDEEEIAEYSDAGSPLFRSDHEFSPESDIEEAGEAQPLKRARTARKDDTQDDDDDHACQKCGKNDHPEWILLCDGCDNGWHCSCLRPALLVIPEGDWYCPPCQHNTLVKNLEEKLLEFDKKLAKREIEVRRKERLAYVGISLANVLPERKKKGDEQPEEEEESESSESRSQSGSDSSTDSDEPIYQLRQRRQAKTYRFNDYDDLINSAIQDEMEAVKGAGNQGRGKDIATIVNAEKEEQKVEDAPEDLTPVAPADSEEMLPTVVPPSHESDDEEEVVGKPKKKFLGRKKSRKLNSLDVSSGDDADSDEDFKGSSSDDDEDEYEEDAGSDDSESYGGKRRGPVRRSTRARTSRYDKEFIDDDSDDAPKRKKNRPTWEDESESEDSDKSWGRRKKTKKSMPVHSKKKKVKRSTKYFDDSDEDLSKKKKPRIKYGGLDDDEDEEETRGRRTRGKKINFAAVLATDSEDEEIQKKAPPRIESDDDYVADDNPEEEDEEVEDREKSEEKKGDEDVESRGLPKVVEETSKVVENPEKADTSFEEPPEDDEELNPIEEMNKNLEEMDEEEMEKMMEEEDYANKQLELMALQLNREKKRKELEAMRKAETEEKRKRKPKLPELTPPNPEPEDLSEPPIPPEDNIPLFNQIPPANVESPKKRRGRGKGKKTLQKEAAAAQSTVAPTVAETPAKPQIPITVENLGQDLSGAKLTIAAPPQPFSQTQPSPSVITRMLQGPPGPDNYGQVPYYPEQATPVETSGVPPPIPIPAVGLESMPQYIHGPRNIPPQYRHPPPPHIYHRGAPVHPPPRMRMAPGPPVYHHHTMDSSPSGGELTTVTPGNTAEESVSPATVPTPAESPHHKNEISQQRFANPAPARHQMQPHRIPIPYQAPPVPPYYGGYVPAAADENLQSPAAFQYGEFSENSPEETPKSYEEETGGEFGGLVSYFSSQREDDLDT